MMTTIFNLGPQSEGRNFSPYRDQYIVQDGYGSSSSHIDYDDHEKRFELPEGNTAGQWQADCGDNRVVNSGKSSTG